MELQFIETFRGPGIFKIHFLALISAIAFATWTCLGTFKSFQNLKHYLESVFQYFNFNDFLYKIIY